VTILGRTAPAAPEPDPLPPEIEVPSAGESTPAAAFGQKTAGTPRWLLAVCVGLALAALVFAILGLQQRSHLQAQQDQTNQLRAVSGQAVAALTTYDYQNLNEWKNSVLTNATGAFQTQFQASVASFEQTYVASHNRGTGTIQGIWVGPVASGKATSVVLVQITVTSLTGTHTLDPYVQVTLLKVAGRWRVDDIEATFDAGGTDGSGGSGATSSPASP
jgi:hypothetical protein